jgi:RNA polymerase sigma factor (sigma-70 family)
MDAEDVSQDIWEVFFVKYSDYATTNGRSARVLYPIARYRIAEFWRRRGRTREELLGGRGLTLLAELLCSDPGTYLSTDNKLDIERALSALPPRQREALHLHYVDDLKVTQTATLMGVAENTVKKLVKRGWRHFARVLFSIHTGRRTSPNEPTRRLA